MIGSEFFTMERIDGRIPPDVMPYNFGDSWLFDADGADQRRLQDATVALLAGIHGIADPVRRFAFLVEQGEPANALVRRFRRTRSWYEWVVSGSARSATIDGAFAVLEPLLPDGDSDRTVLCWGDSRIGNVIYDGFEPVGVLDWEMMALGPPELDVAWLIYGHRVFETIANAYGLPGMPTFLAAGDVVETYEGLTGHRARHLPWYVAYSALRFAIVFLRIGQRSIHFGQQPAPGDVDELIRNRDDLEQLLAGEVRA